jgi:hypothetical protein
MGIRRTTGSQTSQKGKYRAGVDYGRPSRVRQCCGGLAQMRGDEEPTSDRIAAGYKIIMLSQETECIEFQ